MSMIQLKNVSKFYYNKKNISSGFSKINLELDMGEFVVITGESGSGKSTLLNVISGVDSYEEGQMYINGEETSHYTEVDYEIYRRKYIGNIFQHFNLIGSYTVYQNVELVLLLNGYRKKEIKGKVEDIIKKVGLTKFKNTKASKLSGGQKQRVAIARALAKDTPLIVADEPTGNLDAKSAKDILKLLKDIATNKLVIVVTHNYADVEEYATRKITLSDGKIIEDKHIRPFEAGTLEEVDYKDLTLANKLRLGLRNTFNIKTKFALLFMVYFFLTLLVFSEYSGLQKQDFTASLEGANILFNETNPKRIILNKKDKSVFNQEELDNLEKIDNISRVVTDDLSLDAQGIIYSDDYYVYVPCSLDRLESISSVDEGRMPTSPNEAVLKAPKNSETISLYKDDLLEKEEKFEENMTGVTLDKIKIVGIVYDSQEDANSTLYLQGPLMDKIKSELHMHYDTIKLTLDKEIWTNNYHSIKVKSSRRVKKGEVILSSAFASSCPNYICQNAKVSLEVSNIYYKDNESLSVFQIVNNNNYKTLLGLDNYEETVNTIFLNPVDFERLFEKGTYQVSVFLNDLKNDEVTLQTLEDAGYNYYYMRENLVKANEQISGILKLVRNCIFIGATVALFFVCYFIIKVILKSRNVYYATIRILGASSRVASSLLNIELFVDINLAFITFVVLINLAKSGLINWPYVTDLVTYFTLNDYVLVYLLLVGMSLLITNRYARKLFGKSAMSSYREEV